MLAKQDVLQFASTYPEFPHESTANLFFGEARFEAYRALGEHVARSIFERVAAQSNRQDELKTRNRRLFNGLREQWSEALAVSTETYLNSTTAWVTLQRDLRENPLLGRLSREIYPELARAQADDWSEPAVLSEARSLERDRAELHAISEMLQVLEDVWVRLDLDHHHELRLNRGWMNVFRRWTSSKVFQRHWPILRPEFTELIPIIEENLQLKIQDLLITGVRLANNAFQDDRMKALFQTVEGTWLASGLPKLEDVQTLQARAPKDASIAWLASQPFWPDRADRDIPSGLLLLSAVNDDPSVAKMFVWVRPERRACGVGTQLLDRFLRGEWGKLCDAPSFPTTVKASYPAITSARSLSRRERDLWASFLACHGFRPSGDSCLADPTREFVMEITRPT